MCIFCKIIEKEIPSAILYEDDKVIEFKVSGDNLRAIHILPGYTHNIINLSDTRDLVTVMWANEQFDTSKPDTFFEKVK